MSTAAAIITRARVHIREATANDFGATSILNYVSDEHQQMCQDLGGVPGSGWFRYQEDETLAANATTVALSGLDGSGGEFVAIEKIEFQHPGGHWSVCKMIAEQEEAAYRNRANVTVSVNTPPVYFLRRPNLICHPVSTGARTLRITYVWVPSALSSDSDSLSTPSRYDDILAMGVALRALTDEGEDDTGLRARYEQRKMQALDFESQSGGVGVGRSVVFQNDYFA